MSRPGQPEGTVHISDITLKVRQQSGKTLDRIIFQTETGSLKKDIPVTLSPGNAHQEVFEPVLELSVRDRLSISMQYRVRLVGKRTLTIAVQLDEVKTEAQDDNHGRKTYFKSHKDVEITIGVSCYSAPSNTHDAPLPSTTGEILNICPRFRLLIIGNSGVGKSTLIRRVFGVKDVDVSEHSRGQAEIDREFVAEDNGLFVIHDSLGLEAGESNNMDKIKRFISDRRKMKDLKDRLHAVWVCLAVPYAKGRLLESGMEDFLRHRKEILGDIPIVVVLTKLDLLDKSLVLNICGTSAVKNLEEAGTVLEPHRSRFLDEYCTKPLLRAAKDGIPHVAVSTEGGLALESTISQLVKTTTSEIERYVRADPTYTVMAQRSSLERDAPVYIAGMAQRASIEAKVDLTIALGKKRYWRNLGASVTFSSEKVKDYLLVIHQDIIKGWNFNDPEMALQGDSFKVALLDTSNLGIRDVRDVQAALGPVMPLMSALGALINDLIGVAFALPIAGALIFAKLCFEVYKSTQTIVKRFMAYIADLIYVMKILFILAPQGSITSQDVALAVNIYEKSTYRNRVHLEIRDFSVTLILPGGRDAAMEKIEELIRRYSITDKEVAELRSQIQVAPGSSTNVPAAS